MFNHLALPTKIERHKAAIVRSEISRPVRIALQSGFFKPDTSFFDYGCGRGGDIKLLYQLGYKSSGWDPYYYPNNNREGADIVNLGYVINVIEKPLERKEALLKAWELTHKILIVAAQVVMDNVTSEQIAYGDGVVTSRNTFQKYYDQQELKNYIDETLNVDAVPAALGVYFVFRNESLAQTFRAAKFRRSTSAPKVNNKIKNFEDYKDLLTPLMQFVGERGRLPVENELSNNKEVSFIFGTIARAFSLVLQATNKEEWDAIAEKHKQDLLVYIALSKFGNRPKYNILPSDLQNDIKAFFDNYKQACEVADQMLFSLRDIQIIKTTCRNNKIGKLLSDALYVHISALDALDPLLRLYEGCASRTFGRMEGVTLVKFRTDKPKISYLFYPDFDDDPHPPLLASMQVDLINLQVGYRDYKSSNNPFILHRKETFLTKEYPLYEKFARLSEQEEKWGLLDDPQFIGTKNGWIRRLEEKAAKLRGHRLLRVKLLSNPK